MKQNHSIHGLRGLCALFVFIVHAIGMALSSNLLNVNDVIWDKLDILAATGVNIFFVISGYLILHSLVKHNSIPKFLNNRFIRIYPVYLVLLLIMFIIGPVLNYEWFADIKAKEYVLYFFTNLFMLHGMLNFPQAVANSWSLTFEFTFYFISCIFFFGVSRLKSTSIMKYLFLLLGIIISLIIMIVHPRSIFFLVGAIIYGIERKDYSLLKVKVGYGLSLVYLLLTWLTVDINIFLSLIFSFLFFISMVNQTGIVSKVLNTRFFQYFGTISYSFYLWHPFGIFATKIGLNIIGIQNPYLFLVIGTILAVAISDISYRVIEVRVTKLIKGKQLDHKVKQTA